MVYIFLYNVTYIKSDLSKLRNLSTAKFILLGSDYCLQHISSITRGNFDKVYQISRNFQKPDSDEVELIVLEYIKNHGAENIRLLTNEDSAQIICAELREKYNIPGNSVNTILPFVNKVVSKNRLNNIVKIPRFYAFDKQKYLKNKEAYISEIVDYIHFPMFIKPIDLVNSIGAQYVPDVKTLCDSAEMILHHEYEFEVDEFIKGDLFHCDALIINGEVKFFMVGRCSFNLSQFFEGKPVGSIPVIEHELFNKLRLFCDKIFFQLKCPDGAYHTEVFLESATNEVVFLEIGARTGGALITQVYEKLYNLNIEETNYLIQLGMLNEVNIGTPEFFAGFLNFPKIEGKVQKIVEPKLSINYNFVKYVEVDEKMEQAVSLFDVACSIVFWDKSYTKVEQTFEYLMNYEPI